jgi:hypothetical protein
VSGGMRLAPTDEAEHSAVVVVRGTPPASAVDDLEPSPSLLAIEREEIPFGSGSLAWVDASGQSPGMRAAFEGE